MTRKERESRLVAEMPVSACRAIVVMPVRNEEAFVARALAGIACQSRRDGSPLPPDSYEVIVLLNNCTDNSQQEVARFIRLHPRLRIHPLAVRLSGNEANIGYVRRILMNEACARLLRTGKSEGAILSTDSDTVVSPTWIADNCHALQSGCDAVGGRIVLDRHERSQLPPDVQRGYLLDIAYNLLGSQLEAALDPDPCDPWPRHHQHFAASLGVTARAYRDAGGIPRGVKHLEDAALWNALYLDGARLRHSPRISVRTSARMNGRALVGLSSHLRGFADRPSRQVESAFLLALRFTARRHFRSAWTRRQENNGSDRTGHGDLARAAALSGSDPKWLKDVLEREANWPKAMRASGIEAGVSARAGSVGFSQSLPAAVCELRSLLHEGNVSMGELAGARNWMPAGMAGY